MSAPGTRRGVFDHKMALQPLDSSTISLQMGTNKLASQSGMSVYGLGRQVYDPKYCPSSSPSSPPSPPPAPPSPTAGYRGNGSLGTPATNGSEVSDSEYQAELR